MLLSVVVTASLRAANVDYGTRLQLVVTSFGLVGIILALFCLKRYGNRALSLYGFLLVAALFGAMAITYRLRQINKIEIVFSHTNIQMTGFYHTILKFPDTES